jgi:hypothetical protein
MSAESVQFLDQGDQMLTAQAALALARANQSDQKIQEHYTQAIQNSVQAAASRGYTSCLIEFDSMSKKRKQICEKVLLDTGYKIVHVLEISFVIEWG